MLRKFSLIVFVGFISSPFVFAQTKPTLPAVKPSVVPAKVPVSPPAPPALPALKKLNSKLAYAIVSDKKTSPFPKQGDLIKVQMTSVVNNRLMYSTYQANKGKPAEFTVNKPGFDGDIVTAIMLMTPGDSMICQADADAVFTNTKNKKPDFIKKGDQITYFIKLVSIKTIEQIQKEQQVAFQKQMNEQLAKQKKEQEKTIAKDEKLLKEYFTKNNLTPTKTASGLYYTINEQGTGNLAQVGDTAVMSYTGKLLDGTKFDSNIDSAFNHVQPFEFPLGQGRVIKGWDEGVALLNKGSKATFYIPSRYGYGANAQAKIPANSILIFDVELNNIKQKTETK